MPLLIPHKKLSKKALSFYTSVQSRGLLEMREVEPGQDRKVAALKFFFHVRNSLRLPFLNSPFLSTWQKS